MEKQGQRERRDICLQWHNSVSFLHLCLPGKSLSLWTHVRTHVVTHTHAHTHARTHATVSLTFCSVAAAAAGQVVINSKYTSSSAQLMLSHSSSIRHLSHKTNTPKNPLSWEILYRFTSCTATAPVNVGIMTVIGHSSKSHSDQMSRTLFPCLGLSVGQIFSGSS